MTDQAEEQTYARVPEWTPGLRIRQARKSAGLTREELADLTGISERALARYENDEADAPHPAQLAIAIYTDVPFSWLVGSVDDSARDALTGGPTTDQIRAQIRKRMSRSTIW